MNSFTVADVFPLCTVDEMIRKVGRGRYVSLFDAKSGYWQFLGDYDGHGISYTLD